MMLSIQLLIDYISLDMTKEEVDEIISFLDDKDLAKWPVVADMQSKLHEMLHRTEVAREFGDDPSLSTKIAELTGGKPI